MRILFGMLAIVGLCMATSVGCCKRCNIKAFDKPHTHEHRHDDGTAHSHEHHHDGEHNHDH